MSRRAAAGAGALILLAVACGEVPVRSPVEPVPPSREMAVSGAVFGIEGAAPAGLRVTLAGTDTVAANVDAEGRFSLRGTVTGDSVTLIVDAANPAARQAFPALVRVPAAQAAGDLRVVMVPMAWTVQGGSYAGTTVEISMDGAFRPPCNEPGNTNCDGFFPAAWRTGPKLWPAAGLPARLALDHARTHLPFSDTDSVRLWTTVERMNADAGMPLFRPARMEEVALDSRGNPTNGVLVRVDTTLVGFGAWANWWWNASGEIIAGLVRPRNLNVMGSNSLISHELFHTHGVKHSCSWATVMGGYGCGSTQGLSLHDVAHFQLAHRVLEVQRTRGAPHALVAALQGERVVMRGLAPAPFPALEQLRLMHGDSLFDGDHAGHRHAFPPGPRGR
jgi:hypothetical protein